MREYARTKPVLTRPMHYELFVESRRELQRLALRLVVVDPNLAVLLGQDVGHPRHRRRGWPTSWPRRLEEHTSELQSPDHLVCRLLLEKKKKPLEDMLTLEFMSTKIPRPTFPY